MRRQSFFWAVQFQQQNYTQIYHYTKLEITLNFYAVRFTPCASKIGVNLLAQKLPLECFFKCFFVGLLHIFSYFSMNEPELGAGIDPGMAFNPFPSSIWIRRDSNPQPLDCESSSLTTIPDLHPSVRMLMKLNSSELSRHRPSLIWFRLTSPPNDGSSEQPEKRQRKGNKLRWGGRGSDFLAKW